jgi:hypothetical protein
MYLKGKSMSMRKSRKMHRSVGMNKRRSMRRSRMMRGGDIANQGTISGSSAGDPAATDVKDSLISGEGPKVDGQYVPEFDPNKSEMYSGGRKKRRSTKMRGGDDMSLPAVGAQRQLYTTYSGGKRRSRRNRKSRRGGSLLATAAVPFGLWGVQRYFTKSRGSATGSKHRRRRNRRS